MKYRREIDGLRALAIIPIILYHAGIKIFGGGYVGVDIFFVVSGYLITSIILTDLENNNFSIKKFYERRARRILPALYVVLLSSAILAWFLFLPDAMVLFSKSLVAASTFTSNIYFWRTSGYFDTANELKPLIHTWSLAVEEQFYILFPLLLILFFKIRAKIIAPLLYILLVLSICYSQWISTRFPAFNFYLLPTRIWELLIGAMIAIYLKRSIGSKNDLVDQFGSIAGLLLITISVFLYTDKTPFPGIFALIPTIGAALIIIFATDKTFIGKLLSTRLFVGIGLISYSAYLWHQPIYAFSREYLIEVSPIQTLVLTLICFAFAYLSWRFIENPFRRNNTVSTKKVVIFSVLGSFLFIGIGAAGQLTNGFINRYKPDQIAFMNHFVFFEAKYMYESMRHKCNFYNIKKVVAGFPTDVPVTSIDEECYTKRSSKNKTLLLWGDSHTQTLYSGLNAELPKNYDILQITSSGCGASLNGQQSNDNFCTQSNWFAYNTIKKIKPDVVLVAQGTGHDLQSMLQISDALKSEGVKKVIFVGPAPHWLKPLPNIIALKLWENTPNFTKYALDQNYNDLDKKLNSLFPKSSERTYSSLIDNLCNSNGCAVYLGDDKKLGITSWDQGHITPIASQKLAKEVLVPEIMRVD